MQAKSIAEKGKDRDMKKMLSLSFIIGLLSLCIFMPYANAFTYTDTFSGGALDLFWWTPSVENGNTLSVTGGQLVMTQSNYNGSGGVTLNFNIKGDFAASVDYALTVWPANNYERIAISAGAIGAVERSQHPGWFDEAYVSHFSAVGDGVYGIQTAYTSGTLKMERSGNTVTGSYCDGSGCAVIRSFSGSGVSNDTSIGLAIWNSYASVPVEIAFDNFYLNAPNTPDPSGVPEPATMLLLGFGLIGLAGVRRFRK
jgi:hypothetical protein